MSKKDRIWSDDDALQARNDGWLMAITVDSGKRGSYYAVYPHGPKLPDPYRAMRHVIENAQRGSSLHTRALQVISQSRMAK